MDSVKTASILVVGAFAAVMGAIFMPVTTVSQTATCGTVSTCPNVSTPVSGTELFYLVQQGVSKKITYFDLAANMPGGYGGPVGGDLSGTLPNPTIKSSVNLTGSPTTTTQTLTDSTTKIATTAFVRGQTVPAGNVSFTQAGTGAVATTLDQINKQRRLFATDYMTSAQITDGSTRAATIDVTAALNNCLAEGYLLGKNCYLPSGKWLANSAQIVMNASNGSAGTFFGIYLIGDGYGTEIDLIGNPATPPFLITSANSSAVAKGTNTAVYGGVIGVLISCSAAGPCFQDGRANYFDYMNQQTFENVTVVNYNNTSSSATCFQFNAVYSAQGLHLNCVNAAPVKTIVTMTGSASPYTITFTNGTAFQPMTVGTKFSVSGATPSSLNTTSAETQYVVTSSSSGTVTATTSATGTWSSGGSFTGGFNGNSLYQFRKTSYGTWIIGGGQGTRFIYITNDYNTGNTFITPDCEVVQYCVLIDSTHADSNTFYGGTWGYDTYGIQATAGSNNAAFYPNINDGGIGSGFLQPGASTGIVQWNTATMAPLASPSFTGTATFATAPTINSGGIHFGSIGTGTNAYAVCIDNAGNLVRSNTLTC